MDEDVPSSKRRPWRVDKSIHRGLSILTLKSKSNAERFRNLGIGWKVKNPKQSGESPHDRAKSSQMIGWKPHDRVKSLEPK